MAKNKDIITSIIWTLIFVGTQIISSILGVMIISIIYESKVKDISEIVSSNLMLFAILGNIIFIGISFCVFKLFKKKNFLNEPKVSISQFALPLLTILFFSLAWNIVQQNHLSSEYALGDVLNQTMQNNAILFILAVYVLAPIAEEIAFRGIIMRKLQEKRSILLAAVLNSLLFGFTHAMTGNLLTVLFAFVGGMIFSLCYLKTGSLFLTILAHMLGNLCELMSRTVIFFPIEAQYFLAILLGIIATYSFVILIKKCLNKETVV